MPASRPLDIPMQTEAPGYSSKMRLTTVDKINVVNDWILWGNAKKVAEMNNIHKSTLESYMATEWWPEVVESCKIRLQEELDSRMTKALHMAYDEIDDRICNGDYVIDVRTKELNRVPMKGRDLAAIANTTFDKRQLLRGDATTIASKRIENTKELESKFLKIAQDLQAKDVIAVQEHSRIE